MRQDDGVETARLVARCRDGDERAWSCLVDRYKNLVYSVARRSGLTHDDSDDVFMTSFAALYRNLDRIDDAMAVGKWLAVTASRECLRVRRNSQRHVQASFDGPTLEETVADEEATAEHTAIEAVDADTVRDSMSAMDKKCRELLERLFLEGGADYAQVSEDLGMPIGSIGPTRARCLEKLRAVLRKQGFFDADSYQVRAPEPQGRRTR